MPSRIDPLIQAFRGEIMDKIVREKLISLAYKNKGSFLNINDFCDQLREEYGIKVSNRVITGWMKELGIELQSSVTFVNQASLDKKIGEDQIEQARRTGLVPTEDDIDQLFDNE